MPQEIYLDSPQLLTKDEAQLAFIAVHILFFNLTAHAAPQRQAQAFDDLVQAVNIFGVPYDVGRLFIGFDQPDCPIFVLTRKLRGVWDGCL